jgi:hypothetical protein
MPPQLETWERPHYVPGGGEPLLFFVVFGDVDWSQPLLVQNIAPRACRKAST